MSSVTFDFVLEKLRSTIKGQRFSTSRTRFCTSDIVQESAIQVWQQAADEKIPLEQINTAWIKTIAFGHFCKLHRFHLAAKRSTRSEVGSSQNATTVNLTPDEKVSKKENAMLLLSAIENLGVLEAQIVIGKFYESKSLSEIAREIGMSRYQVEKRYLDALKQLENAMAG